MEDDDDVLPMTLGFAAKQLLSIWAATAQRPLLMD